MVKNDGCKPLAFIGIRVIIKKNDIYSRGLGIMHVALSLNFLT